jgi:hypothetical protein
VRDIALKITDGNRGKKEDVIKDAMDAVVRSFHCDEKLIKWHVVMLNGMWVR